MEYEILAIEDNHYDISALGHEFRVVIVPDTDSHVNDADCYSIVDVELWRNDRWSFVGVIVTLLDADGDPTSFDDSLWSVQFGDGDGWHVGWDYTLGTHPVPDMITEVLYKVSQHRAKHPGGWRYPIGATA